MLKNQPQEESAACPSTEEPTIENSPAKEQDSEQKKESAEDDEECDQTLLGKFLLQLVPSYNADDPDDEEATTDDKTVNSQHETAVPAFETSDKTPPGVETANINSHSQEMSSIITQEKEEDKFHDRRVSVSPPARNPESSFESNTFNTTGADSTQESALTTLSDIDRFLH